MSDFTIEDLNFLCSISCMMLSESVISTQALITPWNGMSYFSSLTAHSPMLWMRQFCGVIREQLVSMMASKTNSGSRMGLWILLQQLMVMWQWLFVFNYRQHAGEFLSCVIFTLTHQKMISLRSEFSKIWFQLLQSNE